MTPADKLAANFNSAVMRFADLERYAQRIDRLLAQDEQERQISLQHVPNEEVTIANLFADPFPQVFYASIVISNSILLEQHITGVARTMQEAAGRTLSMSDLRGSLIERFRKYCSSVVDLTISITDADWQFLVGLTELRNVLVHTNGNTEKHPRAQAFVAKHGLTVVEGHVYLDLDQLLPLLRGTWTLIEAIYEAAMQKYPVALPPPPSGPYCLSE